MLSDTASKQIAMYRKRRGWNTERLAEECAALGMPELTSSVLRNIESGRRNSNGTRQRTVSIDELVGIAYALKVSPSYLLIPYPEHEYVDVTPERQIPTYLMSEWFSGNYKPAEIYADDSSNDKREQVQNAIRNLQSHQGWIIRRQAANRSLKHSYNKLMETPASPGVADVLKARLIRELDYLQSLDRGIIEFREKMDDRDWPKPPLPDELKYLDDGVTAEEYDDSYQISVGVNGVDVIRLLPMVGSEQLEDLFGISNECNLEGGQDDDSRRDPPTLPVSRRER